VRAERARRQRESEAMMQAELAVETAWQYLGSGLEEAMNSLTAAEQNLVVMRFFQERSWREVAAALALSEDTVQRRADRALEKLRAYFARKGIAVSAAVIGMTVAANAVQAAPAGFAAIVTAASMAQATGAGASGLFAFLKGIPMNKTVRALLATALVFVVSVPVLIMTTRATRNAVTGETLRKGLVLHFTFDQDETATGVKDGSGSGNHGQVSGARWTAQGRRGGAYEFTADGNEIVVPNSKSLNPERLTLAAWVKTSQADRRWRRIFDKSSSQGYALSVAGDVPGTKSNGWAGLDIGPGAHRGLTLSMVTDVQWHHVVATFDGTRQSLYVDGKPDGEPVAWEEAGQAGGTALNLVIGCNRSGPREEDLGASFRGFIDEPMMWNRALSPGEVAFLYQSQR